MLFKRQICITRDLRRSLAVQDTLSSVGIRSYVRTTNSFFTAGRSHGVPFIDSSAAYEYRIYVKRKDYDAAMGRLRRGEG